MVGSHVGYPDAEPRFHSSADLVCSDCHIVHASQAHGYADGSTPPPTVIIPYAGVANRNLLRTADPVDLCLTCHDGRNFAPDVLSADANGLTQRSAGSFDAPEVVNPMGHDLGRGLPREGWDLCFRCHFSSGDQMKVTCIDCHNPHGNGIARNLQWASDPGATPQLGLFSNPGATGMSRYEQENVSYGAVSGDLYEPSNMCLDCHHIFSGQSYIDAGNDGIHERHPTFDSERSSPNSIRQGEARGSTVPAHWEGGSGSGFQGTSRVRPVVPQAGGYLAARLIDADENGVFCLSCHRAHGSDQPFGLVFPASGGANAPGCDQCHLVANIPQP